jgi:hypothetical protein
MSSICCFTAESWAAVELGSLASRASSPCMIFTTASLSFCTAGMIVSIPSQVNACPGRVQALASDSLSAHDSPLPV